MRRLLPSSKNWLFGRRVAKDNYANFPTLENVVLSGEGVLETVPDWIQGDILSHLEILMHLLTITLFMMS
jgi:hypothetical protein